MGPHLLYMVFQYLFLDLYADIRTSSRSQFLGCIGWCFASLTGMKDVATAKLVLCLVETSGFANTLLASFLYLKIQILSTYLNLHLYVHSFLSSTLNPPVISSMENIQIMPVLVGSRPQLPLNIQYPASRIPRTQSTS